MSNETQNHSDSLGDQTPGSQRGDGAQIDTYGEGQPGASPEGDGGQGSGTGDSVRAGPPAKIVRKIPWSMRFLP